MTFLKKRGPHSVGLARRSLAPLGGSTLPDSRFPVWPMRAGSAKPRSIAALAAKPEIARDLIALR